MPTYAYRCSECGHAFDLRQSFDSASQSDCPRCGKLASRQFTAVPIVFKGSGWYTTDYAKRSGSYPSTPASTNGDGGPSSSNEREDRREKAREERGKPPVPSTPASSSSSSSSGPSSGSTSSSGSSSSSPAKSA